NVLVLNPGTSASAAYFAPLAKDIVAKAKGWQVWAVERWENLLEDHSVLDRAKDGTATGQELFDYYLGWLTDSSITTHCQFIQDADVAFARDWGMRVEIEDLRRVVLLARKHGRRVVVGGHSLGGSITTAYATWDFDGEAGAKGLAGLVFIDGGSNPIPVAPDSATGALLSLQTSSPWLSFGGIPAPVPALLHPTGPPPSPLPPPGLPPAAAAGRPPPGHPDAAPPRDHPGPVRLRARPQDVPAEPHRRAGAPRPDRGHRHVWPRGPSRGPAVRLGLDGRDHA